MQLTSGIGYFFVEDVCILLAWDVVYATTGYKYLKNEICYVYKDYPSKVFSVRMN